MKITKLILSLFYSSILSFSCMSQTTLVLQPDATDGKDALLHGLNSQVGLNYGSNNQLSANTWTYNGSVGTVRSVLEFDLSAIPSGSTITSAELSLYGIGDNSGFGGHSTLSGTNECWVQRITSAWDELTVTWNNQPSVTTVNQVGLISSVGVDDDYLDVDVTMLVQDMVNLGNYGVMIRLQTEDHYRRLNFASSDHSNPSMRPKLKVTYETYPCVTLRPGSEAGKDALLHGLSSEANTNFSSNNQLSANTWTYNGPVGTVRSVLEFDLSGVPAGSTITSAELSLYGIGDNSGFGGHSTLSGSNEAWIQRVTSVWDEATVTWNNQPSVSVVNQVPLAASVGLDDDYIDVDVTALTQDMLNSGNFGYMIRLQTEDYYRRLNFASSDHTDPLMHPKLKVCYQDTLAEIQDTEGDLLGVSLFPNPVVEWITVEIEHVIGRYDLLIQDGQGKVLKKITTSNIQTKVDVSKFENGVYFVSIKSKTGSESKRFVISR